MDKDLEALYVWILFLKADVIKQKQKPDHILVVVEIDPDDPPTFALDDTADLRITRTLIVRLYGQ